MEFSIRVAYIPGVLTLTIFKYFLRYSHPTIKIVIGFTFPIDFFHLTNGILVYISILYTYIFGVLYLTIFTFSLSSFISLNFLLVIYQVYLINETFEFNRCCLHTSPFLPPSLFSFLLFSSDD